MSNIISYRENASQNFMQILPHSHLSGCHGENTEQQMLVKLWAKKNLYTLWVGMSISAATGKIKMGAV